MNALNLPARSTAISSWLLAVLVTSGCGEAAFSPTSPSGTGGRAGSAASGAVITGTVSGMSLSTTAVSEGMTTMAVTKPVTVTVVGTSISTVIDGSGKFRLENVPAGDVRLRFTATGLDATLTLAGVQAGDRIDLKVRVTDTSIRIEADRRDRRGDDDDDDDDDDNELKGVLSNLGGTCPTLTFTVNGTTVKTNSATKFERACDRLVNGTRVEVEGRRQPDQTILATEVELDD